MAKDVRAARKLCAQVGVKVIKPNAFRKPGTTYAVHTIQRLIEKHGIGHATLVLRTIVETEANRDAIVEPVLWAVSDVILARAAWADTGTQWLEAFDRIDLTEMLNEAREMIPFVKVRCAVFTMLLERLLPDFGERRPPRPRSANLDPDQFLALGRDLLAAKAGRTVKALAYERGLPYELTRRAVVAARQAQPAIAA